MAIDPDVQPLLDALSQRIDITNARIDEQSRLVQQLGAADNALHSADKALERQLADLTARVAALETPAPPTPSQPVWATLDRSGNTVPTSNYTPPVGAIWLSTTGNDANAGTEAAPKRTLFGPSGAYAAVPAGGTIVVKAGVYEEGSVGDTAGVPIRNKACTIQAAPGEQVWFDGSVAVTGWTGAGPWSVGGWTYKPGNTSGFIAGGVGDKPATTYFLDMLFIDGVQQTQVTGTPIAGQFAVNHTTGVVTIGTNPAGKEVRLSRYRCLFVAGARINLKGVGVRRYSGGVTAANTNIGVTSGCASCWWGGTSDGLVVERCAFVDTARLALGITRPGATVDTCTFVRSGQTHMNVGGDSGDGFTLRNSALVDSNAAGFPREPGSSGVKIVKADRVQVVDNLIESARGTGVWLDMHVTRFTIARNEIVGGPGCDRAILVELSGGGLLPLTGTRTQHTSYVVGNTIRGGWVWGVFIFDSDHIAVWANRIGDCVNGQIQVLQDERPPAPFWPGTYNSGAVPMIVGNISIGNNDLSGVAGAARIYTGAAAAHYVATDDAVSFVGGNWFAAGANAAKWTTALGVLTNYPTAAGLDARPKFAANGWKNFDGATAPTTRRAPVPADVAALLP